jgi:hypothetical protein
LRGNGFQVRHDRGNRETLDGRWIVVEPFDLDSVEWMKGFHRAAAKLSVVYNRSWPGA